MQITPASLNAVFNSFSLRFQNAFDTATTKLDRLRMVVPSTTRENTYGWMNQIPKLREWLGERVVQNLSAQSYSLTNKDWELTLSVKRNDIQDDQLGIFNPMLDMMGVEARHLPDDLTLQAIQDGETTTCYDGQYFFDTDHPVDGRDASKGTQSNLLTTQALTHDNYGEARAAMMAFKGENGRPLGVMPNLLVVPPQLETTARKILQAETVSTSACGSETNVHRNSAELLVIPELADAPNDWYLFDVSRPVKPFVYQDRQAPQFAYLNQPTAENVFWQKEYIYGVDARSVAGYALWFLAMKCKA
jgi:phage major head subunit gpT-like protein